MNGTREEFRDDLARIATLTSAARATWFTYLGIVAFSGVTLLGVSDADFFQADRNIDLPIVGVSVPVTLFLLFGALLVTVIYGYLHVFLEQLWQALARAPARVGGVALAAAISPWLVSEFALHVRRRLRPDEDPPAVEPSALGWTGVLGSVALLYFAGPIVLAGLWIRSQPAHIAWLTVAIGLMLAAAMTVGWMSLVALRGKLAPGGRSTGTSGLVAALVFAGVAAAVSGVSVARTEWDFRAPGVSRGAGIAPRTARLIELLRPVPASLGDVRLTVLSPDWLPHAEAFAVFRRAWCADRGGDPACLSSHFENSELRSAWQAHRSRWLDVQEKPDLSGRNIDHADLTSAFLPGVALRGASLAGADLAWAQLEGALLINADLRSAELYQAHLEGTNFGNAVLNGASAVGANALAAVFLSTELRHVTFRETDLSFTVMRGADLEGSWLSEARLDHAILDDAVARDAVFSGATLSHASLFRTDLSGTDLTGAWLENVRLYSTNFAGANIVWTYVQGRSDVPPLQTDFGRAVLFGAALRTMDLSQAVLDGPDGLAHVFADGSVILPDGWLRPCHWADEVLDDTTFFGRWRGMIEALGIVRSWDSFVPPRYSEVPALPMPEGCRLAAAPEPASLFWKHPSVRN